MKPARDIVIVGASMAGLRAAEALREGGFSGNLVLVGEEAYEPYDRPPLSKQVMVGTVEPDRTALPRLARLDARWLRRTRATGLDHAGRSVLLHDGTRLPFDRLLVTTGARARPWPNAAEAGLAGVFTLRTRDDAAALRAALRGRPHRVAVIGGGFTGSEVASSCRELGLAVTLIERGAMPLAGALGTVVGGAAAALQLAHGVDLRCGSAVARLEGDAQGRVRAIHLKDCGSVIEADCVVVALGALPNADWLIDSGLAAGPEGLACDACCRVLDRSGAVEGRVFAAGDVASYPYPLFDDAKVRLEHWGNAVATAQVAARNMLGASETACTVSEAPGFWSNQFDVSIKSIGLPGIADAMMVAQGTIERGSFVALYGLSGRLVGAVAFDGGKWLPHYAALIAARASFPVATGMDAPHDAATVPPGFPLAPRCPAS